MKVSHLQQSEACEAVSGVKKKKKKVTRKKNDVHMGSTESADLSESCKDDERDGTKKETHKIKV